VHPGTNEVDDDNILFLLFACSNLLASASKLECFDEFRDSYFSAQCAFSRTCALCVRPKIDFQVVINGGGYLVS